MYRVKVLLHTPAGHELVSRAMPKGEAEDDLAAVKEARQSRGVVDLPWLTMNGALIHAAVIEDGPAGPEEA